MLLKTTYNHALQGFLYYEKGLRGKISLKEMKELNGGMRKIYNEILLDIEKTIKTSQTAANEEIVALPEGSAKATTVANNVTLEVEALQASPVEIELSDAQLTAMSKAINDIQFDSSEKSKSNITGKALILLDEFSEQLTEANQPK